MLLAGLWSVSASAITPPFPQPEAEWSDKLGPLKIKVSQTYLESDDLTTGKLQVFRNGPKVVEKIIERHSSGGTAGFVRLKTQPLPGIYVLPIQGDEMTSELLVHEDGKILQYNAYATWKLTDSVFFALADTTYSFLSLKDFKIVRNELDSEAVKTVFIPGVGYELRKLNGRIYAVPTEEKSEFIEDAKKQIAAGKCVELDPSRGTVKAVVLKAKDLATSAVIQAAF